MLQSGPIVRCAAAAIVLLAGADLASRASDPPATAPATLPAEVDVRYAGPAGWARSAKGSVTFFDAPGRAEGQTCRIAIPSKSMPVKDRSGGGSFREIFEMIQQPDPIIETTRTQAATDATGHEVLRVTKTVTWHGHETRRSYYAVRFGERFTFALFTCSSKELQDAHSGDFETVARSMEIADVAPAEK